MYRAAVARRLLLRAFSGSNGGDGLRFPFLQTVGNFRRSSTASSESFGNQSSNQHPNPQSHPETPNYTDSASSSSTSTSSSSTSTSSSSATQEALRQERQKPRANYEEEQARVLQASLPHVIKLGWSEAALIAGAREVGISPSIIGSFPRKEAVLVEFFMDDCLQRLIDIIDSDKDLRNLILSELISKLVRARLEMQTPHISKWPQALSIQAQPLNVPTSFKQRAMLVDEIWHAAGDEASDIDWYVKRTVVGGIYSTTEVYMLTDNSPDFHDTWAFLDDRVKDAFDLKKTIQEAKYFAEAVGAGMGSSLQGFVKRVFQG